MRQYHQCNGLAVPYATTVCNVCLRLSTYSGAHAAALEHAHYHQNSVTFVGLWHAAVLGLPQKFLKCNGKLAAVFPCAKGVPFIMVLMIQSVASMLHC